MQFESDFDMALGKSTFEAMDAFTTMLQIPVENFTGMFAAFRPGQDFDVIRFVHSLYYFEHIKPELLKAVDLLRIRLQTCH
ncbi:MAG: hypothetical protein RQ741_05305 [Wenzhouxiangellaceae bacterium]|nr:hypothetical protein [Wenzhouxiangellaceae bacterium]